MQVCLFEVAPCDCEYQTFRIVEQNCGRLIIRLGLKIESMYFHALYCNNICGFFDESDDGHDINTYSWQCVKEDVLKLDVLPMILDIINENPINKKIGGQKYYLFSKFFINFKKKEKEKGKPQNYINNNNLLIYEYTSNVVLYENNQINDGITRLMIDKIYLDNVLIINTAAEFKNI